jgi:hypothetical protein
MRKKLITILAVILVLVLVAAVIVHFVGDRVLKAGIETAATKTLGVDVMVGDASFSVFAGTLDLGELVISNPPDYQHPNLLELGKAHVDVDIKSLLGDTVNIEQIKLDGVTMVVEQKGLTNNLNKVLGSIPAGTGEKGGKDKSEGKKLHIANLEVVNVKVRVKLLPIPGRADTVELNLAPIRMTNLGSDNKLDAAVLTGKVLTAIAKGIAREGTDVLPKELTGQIKSTLTEQGELILDTGKEVIEQSKDLGKDAVEKGKDIGQDAVDALKGIFKK